MALIAKETLRLGFTVVALPGNVVSKELVDEQGWADKVEESEPKTKRKTNSKAQAE